MCVCVLLLEKETATHSSTLAWKIPWTEKPGRLGVMDSSPWGRKESDTTERLYLLVFIVGSMMKV